MVCSVVLPCSEVSPLCDLVSCQSFWVSLSMLRVAFFVFQHDWICACFSLSKSARSVFSHSIRLGFSPLTLRPQFLVDLLEGFVPVWLMVMPSTYWDGFFRCTEDCRVKIGGILVDTVLGKGNRRDVEVSEFHEALQVGFLVVPTGRQFSGTGVNLLGKGQDYRFVVAAFMLLLDISFGNLLNVVCGYGNIWCAGVFFPHTCKEGWGISTGVDEDQTVANNPMFLFFSFCI